MNIQIKNAAGEIITVEYGDFVLSLGKVVLAGNLKNTAKS